MTTILRLATFAFPGFANPKYSRNKRLNMSRLFIALGMALTISATAKADTVIYCVDFDTSSTEFEQTTGSAPSSLSVSNTAGVGGTSGAEVTFDTTTSPFSTGFFGDLLPSALINAPTSTSAADYSFSFDVRATGFDTGFSSQGGQAMFQIDGSTPISNTPITITDTFQTITLGFGSGTIDPSIFLAANGRPTFQVELLGLNSFGQDTGNTLVIDNLKITVAEAVPEPGSLLVLSMGIVGLASRRRRSV